MKSQNIEPRLRIMAGIAAAKFTHPLRGKATPEDTKIIESRVVEGDVWTPQDRKRVRELEQMKREGKRGFREGELLWRELCDLGERDPHVDRYSELLMRFDGDGTQSLDDFKKELDTLEAEKWARGELI